uniref:DNA polymerase epsilon subunit 3 n=1 Tax=Syphacia muris TaxID=451379 RepID=A0A0N5AGI7_9BILA
MSSSTHLEGIEDLRLPQTVVGRIIKDALPPGVIVSKEARTAISRAATVFILHATTYAECCAISNKRKTVTAADVITAIGKLDCDDLEKPVNFKALLSL